MIWIVVVSFAILTILFLSGKGGALIAGYNTSSKEQKALYNVKKLCRLMGCCMGVITICLCLEAIEAIPYWLKVAGGVVMLADIFLTLILANSSLVKSKEAAANKQPSKQSRALQWGTGIFTGVILLGVVILLFTGSIQVVFHEDVMEIQSSYWADEEVPWDQIEKVTYLESLPKSSRTNGLGSYRLQAGHFFSDDIGNYIRYTYVKCGEYIQLDTESGIVIINQETPQQTKELYEELRKKIKE